MSFPITHSLRKMSWLIGMEDRTARCGWAQLGVPSPQPPSLPSHLSMFNWLFSYSGVCDETQSQYKCFAQMPTPHVCDTNNLPLLTHQVDEFVSSLNYSTCRPADSGSKVRSPRQLEGVKPLPALWTNLRGLGAAEGRADLPEPSASPSPASSPSVRLSRVSRKCCAPFLTKVAFFLWPTGDRPVQKSLAFREEGLGLYRWLWESLSFLSQLLLLRICKPYRAGASQRSPQVPGDVWSATGIECAVPSGSINAHACSVNAHSCLFFNASAWFWLCSPRTPSEGPSL